MCHIRLAEPVVTDKRLGYLTLDQHYKVYIRVVERDPAREKGSSILILCFVNTPDVTYLP